MGQSTGYLRELRETRLLLERRLPILRSFFQGHDRMTNRDYREIAALNALCGGSRTR